MQRPSAYRVFLTRKSEYHVRSHACFGVRDRRTGAWLEEHWALGRRLATALPDARGAMCSLGLPLVGERLCFLVDGAPHYTSEVIAVEGRAHFELPSRVSPQLEREILRRPEGTSRETY
jgi:hypothetical protein